MGSLASPEIADITFHNLETEVIDLHRRKIIFWKQFRDDVSMRYMGTETELRSFMANINELHQYFKFRIEYILLKLSFTKTL